MAHRIFYAEKLYDYTSKNDADKHIVKMRQNGWFVKEQYEQNDGPYKWTVVYQKQY